MKSLALVVPCYNEAARLDEGAFSKAVKDYEYLSIVFVNDGSRDDTHEILSRLSKASARLTMLSLPVNCGKAAAVRAGIDYLLKHTSSELLGFWDADLATPLSLLPEFVAVFERQADLAAVIGSRWPHLGAELKRRKFRRFAAWLVNAFIRRYLGVRVWDTQCGAKVFTRAAAAELFGERFCTRWLFDVEILSRLGRERLERQVRELAIDDWRDVPGSKLSVFSFPQILFELLRLLFCRVRQ